MVDLLIETLHGHMLAVGEVKNAGSGMGRYQLLRAVHMFQQRQTTGQVLGQSQKLVILSLQLKLVPFTSGISWYVPLKSSRHRAVEYKMSEFSVKNFTSILDFLDALGGYLVQ